MPSKKKHGTDPDRVPKALVEAFNTTKNWGGSNPKPWDELSPNGRAFAREQAIAALKALREPTDKMIEDGWQIGNSGYGEGEEEPYIFRAMIDAAIEEIELQSRMEIENET